MTICRGWWVVSSVDRAGLPAGGEPKDGLSPGVTIVVALVSALTRRAVRGGVAITAEMTGWA